MVESDDDVHALADRDRVVFGDDQPLLYRFGREDRGLPRWNDRARDDRPERPGVVERERPSAQVVERQPPRLRTVDDVPDRAHETREALPVGVLDDRHDQAVLPEGDRVAEVDLFVEHQTLIGPARVHLRDRSKRLDDGLRDEGRWRKVEALARHELLADLLAVLHQLGDIDFHDRMRVRRAPRLRHVVRDRAAHLRERDELIAGERRRRDRPTGRGLRLRLGGWDDTLRGLLLRLSVGDEVLDVPP